MPRLYKKNPRNEIINTHLYYMFFSLNNCRFMTVILRMVFFLFDLYPLRYVSKFLKLSVICLFLGEMRIFNYFL